MAERKKRLKLSTPTDVRKALSRIANLTLNGEIDTKVANTIILACNAILSGIKTIEYENKIKELEEILMERDG